MLAGTYTAAERLGGGVQAPPPSRPNAHEWKGAVEVNRPMIARAVMAAGVCAVVLTGCTADHGRPVVHKLSSTVPSATTVSARVTGVPPSETGMATLATLSARTGNAAVGPLHVKAGALWIASMCTGGKMTIEVGSTVSLPVTCAANGVTPSGNQITFSEAKDITVRVDATAGVVWNLRVQQ